MDRSPLPNHEDVTPESLHRQDRFDVDTVPESGEEQGEGQHEGDGADGDDEPPAAYRNLTVLIVAGVVRRLAGADDVGRIELSEELGRRPPPDRVAAGPPAAAAAVGSAARGRYGGRPVSAGAASGAPAPAPAPVCPVRAALSRHLAGR